jgi:hypothetical protein
MTTPVDLLIKRNIFASEEEAISDLVREYIIPSCCVVLN